MSQKVVWKLVSLLMILSLPLSACGPKPTTTPASVTQESTPEPTTGPTVVPTVRPLEFPDASDGAPTIIQQSPPSGAELALDGAIELVFNQPMDRAAVEAAFRIEPAVQGTFTWANDQTVSFQPAAPLPRAGVFQVSLDQTALATTGAQLDDAYRFRFAAVGYLEVAQVLPAPDTRDAEPDSIITVIFNRPVVPLTTLTEQAGLPQSLALEPAVEGKGEWLNTSIYVFRPDQPLVGGTTYTARVAAGLSDTTGGVLAEDYRWTFTTRPPVVVWHEPHENQELVPITQAITVTFNQPMDATSMGGAFSVVDASGSRVPGMLGVRNRVVTFEPEGKLAFDTRYEVRVAAGVLPKGGSVGMGQAYNWRFTTVPLPRIVRTDPADGDQNAYPYTSFTIFFNAPIEPSTVMPNLQMTPPISKTGVYTWYNEWDQSFNIDFGAEPSSEYVVEIGPDIADPYGNTTGQPMTVRFRTRELDPMVQLCVPDFVGTYNAYDPAQLFVAHQNVSRLEFELYRVAPERYLELNQRWGWDQFRAESDEMVRTWNRPVERSLNTTAYTRIDLVEGGGRLEPGLYFLILRAPEVGQDQYWWGWNRHVLVVSQVNLTIKRSDNELLAWATDLKSGDPVSGLNLTVRTEDGGRYGALTTAADGTVTTADIPPYGGAWLMSEQPFAMGSDFWERGLSSWDFGFEGGEWAQDYRAHIYTDRPIYRPDQTVYFRGILRAEDDAVYRPAGASQVDVVIRDPNWKELFNKQLPLSEYGAFHGELNLPAGAALGDYAIEVRLGDHYFNQSFQVAAYRTPQFEVLVTPAKDEIVAGESAQAEVVVRTFFGSPVAGAAVEWNVLAAKFDFVGIGNYSYSASDDPWGWYRWWWEGPTFFPEPILSGNGTTDGQGRLLIEVPADLLANLADEQGSQAITVEATVYGPDNSVISGRGNLTVHQGNFYLGVAARDYVARAGDETTVDLIALDWVSQRLPNLELTAELYRREYENILVETDSGSYWEWKQNDVLVETVTTTTDELGEATASFVPPEGGTYRVLVSAIDHGGFSPEDSRGRTVRSSTFFWVTSPETISWRRDNHDRINLVTDKLSYLPGETAEILIPSPFEGKQLALITVERADVKYYEVITMETNSTVYRLPIAAEHAPNIYVSAVIIKGQDASSKLADYRVGYAALEVDTGLQELAVSLTPSPEQASPGGTVTYDLRVTDSNGEPVQGEFSLDVVDKGVLSLRPRMPEAILQAFYGKRALGVRTASGLALSVNRLLEQQQDVAQDLGRGGGEDEETAMEAPPAEPGMAHDAAMPAVEVQGVYPGTRGGRGAARVC